MRESTVVTVRGGVMGRSDKSGPRSSSKGSGKSKSRESKQLTAPKSLEDAPSSAHKKARSFAPGALSTVLARCFLAAAFVAVFVLLQQRAVRTGLNRQQIAASVEDRAEQVLHVAGTAGAPVGEDAPQAQNSSQLGQRLRQLSPPSAYFRAKFSRRKGETLNSQFHINPKAKQTSRHLFVIGDWSSHHTIYEPLGLSQTSGLPIARADRPACSGTQSLVWLDRNCPAQEEHALAEYSMPAEPKLINPEAFNSLFGPKADGMRRIQGTTLLQFHTPSSRNIAHFVGRVLHVHHVLKNLETYGLARDSLRNIVINMDAETIKRLRESERLGSYHRTLIEIVAHPLEVLVGESAYARLADESATGPAVLVLAGLEEACREGAILFDRAVVMGYVKASFFLRDVEYFSARRYFFSPVYDAPTITRDSMAFRENVDEYLRANQGAIGALNNSEQVELGSMRPRVVYVERSPREGNSRLLEPESKTRLYSALSVLCNASGYSFEVVRFEGLTAVEQISLVRDAAVYIGVHGANLVNAIFLPPLAVLIEIFPYRFFHEMYKEGGAASVKYFGLQLSHGAEFPQIEHYGSNAKVCMHESHACKVFYRDAELRLSDEDFSRLGVIMESAFEFLQRVGAPLMS